MTSSILFNAHYPLKVYFVGLILFIMVLKKPIKSIVLLQHGSCVTTRLCVHLLAHGNGIMEQTTHTMVECMNIYEGTFSHG